MQDNTPTTTHAGDSNPRSSQNFSWGFLLLFILVAPVAVITALAVYFLFSIVKIHYKVLGAFVLLYGLGVLLSGQAMNVLTSYSSSFLKMFPYLKEQAWGDLFTTLFINQAPLSLFVGGVIGYIISWWRYKRRPVWVETKFRRTPIQLIRRAINIRNIQKDKGTPPDGRTLGVSYEGDRITQTQAEGTAHTFVVGASGTGKTTTLMVGARDMIKRGESLVFVDMKGSSDIPEVLEEYCQRYGRRFLHWTMQNPDKKYTGPSKLGPAYYDPLRRGDATRRSDLLISLRDWTEEHYKVQTKAYLQKVLDVAIASPESDDKLDSLKEAILLLDPNYLKKRCLPLVGNPRYTAILDAVNDEIDGTQDRDAKSLLKTTKNHFTLLRNSTPGHWLRKDPSGKQDINLFDVAHAGDVVLFTIDSLNYEDTSRNIGNLIIQDIKTVAGELMGSKADAPMNVIIDEFSAIGSDSISNLLARCREANVPVTLSTQSLGDLREVSEAFLDKLTGIIGSFILHRANSAKDAEIYAGFSGKEKKYSYRESVEHTSGFFGGIGKGSATGSGNVEAKMEYVVSPEEIQGLQQGQMIYIAKSPRSRIAHVQVIKEDIITISNENDNSMDIEDAEWRASGDDYVTGVDEETAIKNRVDPTINPHFLNLEKDDANENSENLNNNNNYGYDNPYENYEEHPSNRDALARIFNKTVEYEEPSSTMDNDSGQKRATPTSNPRTSSPKQRVVPAPPPPKRTNPVPTEGVNREILEKYPAPAPVRNAPRLPYRASNGTQGESAQTAQQSRESGLQGVRRPRSSSIESGNGNMPIPEPPQRSKSRNLPPLPPKRKTNLPKPPTPSNDGESYITDW